MNKTMEIMTRLISYAICNGEIDKESVTSLTDDELKRIFALSKRHDISHIIGYALTKLKVKMSGALSQEILSEQMVAVSRYEQQNYEYERVSNILNDIKIDFIPLKGAVIRKFYPEPWLRTSCDIDILIKEQDLDKAVKSLEIKGYRFEKREYHDISCFSSSGVHIELHFSLLEKEENLDRVLKQAWEHTVLEYKHRYKFTDEFYLFHYFSHAMYHFLHGGCGFRSLIDLWVIENRMGLSVENSKELLQKANIYTFSEELTKLTKICFENVESNDFSDTLLRYILKGGVYGSLSNNMALNKEKTKNRLYYTLKRWLLPYKDMKEIYPKLRKYPILLPYYWLKRLFTKIFGGKGQGVMKEVKAYKSTDNKDIAEIQEIKDKFGLK